MNRTKEQKRAQIMSAAGFSRNRFDTLTTYNIQLRVSKTDFLRSSFRGRHAVNLLAGVPYHKSRRYPGLPWPLSHKMRAIAALVFVFYCSIVAVAVPAESNAQRLARGLPPLRPNFGRTKPGFMQSFDDPTPIFGL